MFHPAARLNDGQIVLEVNNLTKKKELIQVFKEISKNGNHVNLPTTRNIYGVTKAKFVPTSNCGLTMEGELFDNSIYEIELIPQHLHVMGFAYELD